MGTEGGELLWSNRLDVENETLIQAALSRLIKDKTVLVVAHHMCTVSSADKVVVLSDGSVAEQGTLGELMNTGRILPTYGKTAND